MTTKAFLKTAEKKRDTSQAKESTPITPITPVDAKPSVTLAPPEKPAQETFADAAPASAPERAKGNEQVAEVSGPAAYQDAAHGSTGEAKGPPPAADDQVRILNDALMSLARTKLSTERTCGRSSARRSGEPRKASRRR